MSVASRARAAEKEDKKWADLIASNRVKAAKWLTDNMDPLAVTKNREAAEREFDRGAAAEPVPHWVLPIGEALVNPDYFSPPTADMNGKPSPILTVRAFHHSISEGVTFERVALGSPWVRAA